jgi:hypothetical protein
MTPSTRRALLARAYARSNAAREVLLEVAEDLERAGFDSERAVAEGLEKLTAEMLSSELAKILT